MYSIFQKLNCDLWNTNTQLFSLNFCLFPETCYILLFLNKIFNSHCKKNDLSARLSRTAYGPNPENTYIILHPLLFYTSDMYIHSTCTYSTTQFSPFLQARESQDTVSMTSKTEPDPALLWISGRAPADPNGPLHS